MLNKTLSEGRGGNGDLQSFRSQSRNLCPVGDTGEPASIQELRLGSCASISASRSVRSPLFLALLPRAKRASPRYLAGMANSKAPRLWLRIIVPGTGAIGPGKIDLLRSIEKTQSISAAARDLDMSYRRAWMLLDETRRVLGADILVTHAGGADRGGAALTEAGRNLIATYDRICAAAGKAAQGELDRLSFARVPVPGAATARKKRKAKVS